MKTLVMLCRYTYTVGSKSLSHSSECPLCIYSYTDQSLQKYIILSIFEHLALFLRRLNALNVSHLVLKCMPNACHVNTVKQKPLFLQHLTCQLQPQIYGVLCKMEVVRSKSIEALAFVRSSQPQSLFFF